MQNLVEIECSGCGFCMCAHLCAQWKKWNKNRIFTQFPYLPCVQKTCAQSRRRYPLIWTFFCFPKITHLGFMTKKHCNLLTWRKHCIIFHSFIDNDFHQNSETLTWLIQKGVKTKKFICARNFMDESSNICAQALVYALLNYLLSLRSFFIGAFSLESMEHSTWKKIHFSI